MKIFSNLRADLLLVAATVLATLAVRRQLSSVGGPLAVKRNLVGNNGLTLQPSAETPLEIQPVGWMEILRRTYDRITAGRLLAIAAGTVFYGLLALFPAVTALVSSYGLFVDPSTIAANLQSLAVMLPEGSFSVIEDQVARVLAKGSTSLGFTFVGSFLLALWSANTGMKSIIDALNVVYEEEERRGFLNFNLVSLGLTVAALGGILMILGAVVVVPLALDRLGIDQHVALWIAYGRWPLLGMLLLVGLAVLYRLGPNRRAPQWQWLSPGAVAATVLWLGGASLLSWYLSNFANYSATYGSLGAAIGLMMWMWMSSICVLAERR